MSATQVQCLSTQATCEMLALHMVSWHELASLHRSEYTTTTIAASKGQLGVGTFTVRVGGVNLKVSMS